MENIKLKNEVIQMNGIPNGVYAVRVADNQQVKRFVPEEILEQQDLNRKTQVRRQQAETMRQTAAVKRECAAFRKMIKSELMAAAICLTAFGVHQGNLASPLVSVPVMVTCFGYMCFTVGQWLGQHKELPWK